VKKFLQDNLSLPSELGVLCALAGVNPRVRAFQITGRFAHAAQIITDSSAKDAKKESGFVGAGLKPALLDLAHREICARRANYL